jgi:hypothetical protein
VSPAAAAIMVGLSVLIGAVLGMSAGWFMARMAKRTEAELIRSYGLRPEREPDGQSEPGG